MKKRVGLLFGGPTAEHEVSLQSAKNIYQAIDKEKYEIVPIGMDKEGNWYYFEDGNFLVNENNPTTIRLNRNSCKYFFKKEDGYDYLLKLKGLDVVFSVVHGTLGEDGSFQGMFNVLGIPYVGPDVLSSAICMDKDITKRLLKEKGIDVAKSFTFMDKERDSIDYEELIEELSFPIFIKPARQGSSIGVGRAYSKEELKKAVETAFEFDRKVLIEEAIVGREIECAVLGNEDPIVSVPGEVVSSSGFYSYDEKYVNSSKTEVPAKLSETEIKQIQETAIKTYRILQCEGMARVDFFLSEDKLYVNEVNTLPGFTKISMYPKMFEASGIAYGELIDRLITLAIQKNEELTN